MARRVAGKEYGQLLCEALGLEANSVSRIVIDCKVREVVTIHVQYLGDERLFDVLPPADEVKIIDGTETP